MSRLHDLLQRFRSINVPGGASTGNVPADRAADMAGELRPLFEALAQTQAQCRALVEAAAQDAERVRAAGVKEAAAVHASVPERAQVERAQAADALIRRSAEDGRTRSREAQRSAAAVCETARRQLPHYVEAVVSATGLR